MIPEAERNAPDFKPSEPRESRLDAHYLGVDVWPHGFYEQRRDMWRSTVSVDWKGNKDFEIQGRRYFTFERTYYETNEERPAESRFRGEAGHRIELEDRTLYLHTTIDLFSDSKMFYATLVREIFEKSILVRRREWKEKIPRMFH